MNTNTMEQFETLHDETLATVEGGWGYRWRCDNGKTSAWHMFKDTAMTNANNYMIRNPGVICTVDHD